MDGLYSPSPSPAPSLGDLRAYSAQPRVRRKPAPAPPDVIARDGGRSPFPCQDREERYPTPDPSDPFAPLWVLRQRTASAPLRGFNDSRDSLDTFLVKPHICDTSKSQTPLLDAPAPNIIHPLAPISPRPRKPSTLKKTPRKQKGEKSDATTQPVTSRTNSPRPVGHYTPYSQQHAFPTSDRSEAPHIFTSPGRTPLRSGISLVRMHPGGHSCHLEGESDASESTSSTELVFRPMYSTDSFDYAYAKTPSIFRGSGLAEGRLAPGICLESTPRPSCPSKDAKLSCRSPLASSPSPVSLSSSESPVREHARQRLAQWRELWKPTSGRKRSMSVSVPSPVPVASTDFAARPTGANSRLANGTPPPLPLYPSRLKESAKIVSPTAPAILPRDAPSFRQGAIRKEVSAVQPCEMKANGSAMEQQRSGVHHHLHQGRTLSMGVAAASGSPGPQLGGVQPPESDEEHTVDPASGSRIACMMPEFPLLPDSTSPFTQNTPTAGTIIAGRDPDGVVGNSLPLSGTTYQAHHDGLDLLHGEKHRSHEPNITDSSVEAKHGSGSDLLGPRIKALDEGRRPWTTPRDMSTPPLRLPLKELAGDSVSRPATAPAMPLMNRPSITFAPPKSPEPASPGRKSMKASILATVFATSTSKAVSTTMVAVPSTKESVSETASGAASRPPLRKKLSKLSSISSASSSTTSSASMVFANPDYVATPKMVQRQKISSPEPSPTFDHSMNADTFASPRRAPVPPSPTGPRSPKVTRSLEPILVEQRSRSDLSASTIVASPTESQHRGEKGEKDSQHGPSKTCDDAGPSEWALPSTGQISLAGQLPVFGEDGKSVQFGSLFKAHRTIVIFIRHFWCPLCQDYMSSLRAIVRPDMLARPDGAAPQKAEAPQRSRNAAPAALRGSIDGQVDGASGRPVEQELVSFVVIGNGAHGMIRKYRQIFGLPFAVYTDPGLDVYRALGMGRDGDDGHRHLADSLTAAERSRRATLNAIPRGPSTPKADDAEKEMLKDGGYSKRGVMGGIAMVVVRALKVGMPVWERGGDIGQLGGEFIFGPGLTCSFAHRMQTTKGHTPIENVLEAAGIDVTLPSSPTRTDTGRRRHSGLRESMSASHKRVSSSYSTGIMSREEEEDWMAERQRQLDALHERKLVRRGVLQRSAKTSDPTEARRLSRISLVQEERVLEPVGEVSEDMMEEGNDDDDFRRHSVDTAGMDADDEDDDDTLEGEPKSQNDLLMDEIQERLHSMSMTNLNEQDTDSDKATSESRHFDSVMSDTEESRFSKEEHDWPLPPSHLPSLRNISS